MNDAFYEEEEWREVDGYPGYLVNRNGEIFKKLDTGELVSLNPEMDSLGFLEVRLKDGNSWDSKKAVGRIVAEAFIDCPDYLNCREVSHADGDLFNNNASNIKWASCGSNPDDDARNNYILEKTGKPIPRKNVGSSDSDSAYSKSRKERRICSEDLETGSIRVFSSIAEACRELGVSGIKHVLSGKQKSSGGYIFWYE